MTWLSLIRSKTKLLLSKTYIVTWLSHPFRIKGGINIVFLLGWISFAAILNRWSAGARPSCLSLARTVWASRKFRTFFRICDWLTAYFKMAANKRRYKLSFIHYFPMGCKSQFDFHLIENVALEKQRFFSKKSLWSCYIYFANPI